MVIRLTEPMGPRNLRIHLNLWLLAILTANCTATNGRIPDRWHFRGTINRRHETWKRGTVPGGSGHPDFAIALESVLLEAYGG